MTDMHDRSTSPEDITNVNIETVGGDFRLRGVEGPKNEFQIKAEIPNIQRDGGFVTISSGGDCVLDVAADVDVTINTIGGDAKITNIAGKLHINSIGGDFSLRHIEEEVAIQNIGGDFVVRHVEGAMTVHNVAGDMDCRHIEGDLILHNVSGDLSVRDVEGSCQCHGVRGDLLLGLDFEPDHTYFFNCNADVLCRLDEHADVTFVLPRKTEYDLGNFDGAVVTVDQVNTTIKIGEGGPEVRIEAGGGFYITDRERRGKRFAFNFDFDFPEFPEPPEPPEPPIPPRFNDDWQIRIDDEPLGEFISRQINEAMSNIGNLGNRARSEKERMKREAVRAKRHAARMQNQAERIQRQVERAHRRSNVKAAPPPAANPVSEEERLMVLSMLEDGKITVEEAEQILRTMEGD